VESLEVSGIFGGIAVPSRLVFLLRDLKAISRYLLGCDHTQIKSGIGKANFHSRDLVYTPYSYSGGLS